MIDKHNREKANRLQPKFFRGFRFNTETGNKPTGNVLLSNTVIQSADICTNTFCKQDLVSLVNGVQEANIFFLKQINLIVNDP